MSWHCLLFCVIITNCNRIIQGSKSLIKFRYLKFKVSEYTRKGRCFRIYAVIEACGKQYKVAEGDVVFFEKLDAEEGKKVTFENVVLVSDEGKVEVGAPYVKGIKVEGKVVAHGKGKKIIVFKYKPKKNYRRKQGHRQPYTKVEIKKIG